DRGRRGGGGSQGHQKNMNEQDSLGSVVDVHLVLVALLEVALDLLAKDGGPVLTVLTEQILPCKPFAAWL
ncbi:MAG: hypothetical protein ACK56I_24915, partial [bacterium]